MNASITKIAAAIKMYETENDLSSIRRLDLAALMNQRLASAVDVQMQMKQAHWNVKGPSFFGLHELFDKVDAAVAAYVDLIAERIVQLGGIAEGPVRVVAARSRMASRMSKPQPTRFPPSATKFATQLRRRTPWATRTRRTCSSRSRAGSINGCGLLKPIRRQPNSGREPCAF